MSVICQYEYQKIVLSDSISLFLERFFSIRDRCAEGNWYTAIRFHKPNNTKHITLVTETEVIIVSFF